MIVQRDLCAFKSFYDRSGIFMIVQPTSTQKGDASRKKRCTEPGDRQELEMETFRARKDPYRVEGSHSLANGF
jgi:hypothetical protein